MRKCVLCHMRTTKAQISLRIRAVWSAPLFSLLRYYSISKFCCRNFKTLASFCSCAGRFVSGLVGNSQRHILSCRGSTREGTSGKTECLRWNLTNGIWNNILTAHFPREACKEKLNQWETGDKTLQYNLVFACLLVDQRLSVFGPSRILWPYQYHMDE